MKKSIWGTLIVALCLGSASVSFADTFQITNGVVRAGSDLLPAQEDGLDMRTCEARCLADNRCVAFNHINEVCAPGTGARSNEAMGALRPCRVTAQAKCNLKSAVPRAQTANSGAQFGVRQRVTIQAANTSVPAVVAPAPATVPLTPAQQAAIDQARQRLAASGNRCRNWDVGQQQAYCQLTIRNAGTWACPSGYQQHRDASPFCMKAPDALPPDWRNAPGCGDVLADPGLRAAVAIFWPWGALAYTGPSDIDCNRYGLRF